MTASDGAGPDREATARELLHLVDNPEHTPVVGAERHALCGKVWTPHRADDATDNDGVCPRCVIALGEEATWL